MEPCYICIDLKSFYASVECRERGLDPLRTNLVVADASRTEKTICLAVTPSLKEYGIPGRARLFEVVQRVRNINGERRHFAPEKRFYGSSSDAEELKKYPGLEVSYIVAPPRMALYMKYSTDIYRIYLKYFAPEDIHVYSVDEVFIDAASYMETYRMPVKELVQKIILDIVESTGITATAGIGTNMYLAKVALDIVAKHVEADEKGVRIAMLDEMSYRKLLWGHKPLTDFWRVGKGYANKLAGYGVYTMGDVAELSLSEYGEDLLYRLFGVNAELLIDHAWGWEPCTMKQIKEYKPSTNSISTGQVLSCPYDFEKGRLIVKEMTDLLVFDLLEKGLVTDQIVLTVGYDIENLTDPERRKKYKGPVTTDAYGRKVPKHAHGTGNLDRQTSSHRLIMETVMELYDRIMNPDLLMRRLTLAANHVVGEDTVSYKSEPEQLNLFTDYEAEEKKRKTEEEELEKERKIQQAVLSIKKKYGKNAVLRGMNLEEGAQTIARNGKIGGHKA